MVVDTLGDLIATLGSIDDDEIDWQNIRQATVLIQQTFRYDYPGPITDLRQRLIVVPPDYHGHQRLTTHKLRVSGCNLEIERSYDSFGNVVLDLTLEEVDGHVEFTTWAVVECHVPERRQRESRRHRLRPSLRRAVAAHPARRGARAVAAELRASGATGLDLAQLVGTRVHDHFVYEWGVTSVETTAAEAWAAARGVCQDYAHCMVALCRLCGAAGPLRVGPPARRRRHARLGRGPACRTRPGPCAPSPFDPTHDRRAGPRYVTVAVGRDYGDVAPTSGTFEAPFPGELTTHKRAAVVRVEYLQPPRRRRVSS